MAASREKIQTVKIPEGREKIQTVKIPEGRDPDVQYSSAER